MIKSLSKIKLGMVIVSNPGTSLVSLKTSVSPCQEHRRQTALDKVWGRTRGAEAGENEYMDRWMLTGSMAT